jgi:RNA polymerase sigma-70 factor (ECF subfamily)
MKPPEQEVEELLARASRGDAAAQNELFQMYRQRLKRMIALRMDQRLHARFDPSDVVQDALVEANLQLLEYCQERPLPFYPWLRQIAFSRLLDLHRQHILAQKRSVDREEHAVPALPDASVLELAQRLLGTGTTPSGKLMRAERRQRVQAALQELPERDREILVLRYLEKLSTSEMAAVLGISEGAVKVRHVRALERIRVLLGDPKESQP